ncbi:hypothetical protein F5883DRAFT_656358 [Diaporthe sp. PMI_573]|nr:hypothetical protein F5883DRAFT_656358 [Diaporthaceae sp. PMI_573]
MALFGFVAGVDIYSGLWAGRGFISTAAWASLGVSTVAILIYIIALKASSLRLLNAADSSDGATYKIRILFGLALALISFPPPKNEEEDKEPNNLKNQTLGGEKLYRSKAPPDGLSDKDRTRLCAAVDCGTNYLC